MIVNCKYLRFVSVLARIDSLVNNEHLSCYRVLPFRRPLDLVGGGAMAIGAVDFWHSQLPFSVPLQSSTGMYLSFRKTTSSLSPFFGKTLTVRGRRCILQGKRDLTPHQEIMNGSKSLQPLRNS